MSMNPKNIKPKEGALYNPDIRIPDEKIEIKDQYHKIYKMPNRPRNGIFSLGKNQIFQDQEKEALTYDNAIDPNQIRKRVDPDEAHPDLSSAGLFSFEPDSTRKSHNQVGLIRKSHESELNYRNRFLPRGADPDDAVDRTTKSIITDGDNKRKETFVASKGKPRQLAKRTNPDPFDSALSRKRGRRVRFAIPGFPNYERAPTINVVRDRPNVEDEIPP